MAGRTTPSNTLINADTDSRKQRGKEGVQHLENVKLLTRQYVFPFCAKGLELCGHAMSAPAASFAWRAFLAPGMGTAPLQIVQLMATCVMQVKVSRARTHYTQQCRIQSYICNTSYGLHSKPHGRCCKLSQVQTRDKLKHNLSAGMQCRCNEYEISEHKAWDEVAASVLSKS